MDVRAYLFCFSFVLRCIKGDNNIYYNGDYFTTVCVCLLNTLTFPLFVRRRRCRHFGRIFRLSTSKPEVLLRDLTLLNVSSVHSVRVHGVRSWVDEMEDERR